MIEKKKTHFLIILFFFLSVCLFFDWFHSCEMLDKTSLFRNELVHSIFTTSNTESSTLSGSTPRSTASGKKKKTFFFFCCFWIFDFSFFFLLFFCFAWFCPANKTKTVSLTFEICCFNLIEPSPRLETIASNLLTTARTSNEGGGRRKSTCLHDQSLFAHIRTQLPRTDIKSGSGGAKKPLRTSSAKSNSKHSKSRNPRVAVPPAGTYTSIQHHTHSPFHLSLSHCLYFPSPTRSFQLSHLFRIRRVCVQLQRGRVATRRRLTTSNVYHCRNQTLIQIDWFWVLNERQKQVSITPFFFFFFLSQFQNFSLFFAFFRFAYILSI